MFSSFPFKNVKLHFFTFQICFNINKEITRNRVNNTTNVDINVDVIYLHVDYLLTSSVSKGEFSLHLRT